MNTGFVLTIVRLRLLRTLKDRSNVVWLVLMPLVFAFLMGILMGDWERGPAQRPGFLVHAADSSAAARQLLEPLQDREEFLLVRADTTVSAEAARRHVETGRFTAVLLLGPGYGDSLAAGLTPHLRLFHDSERSSAQKVRQAVAATVATANARAAAQTLVARDPMAPGGGEAAAFDEARFQAELAVPRLRLEVATLGRPREADLVLSDSRQHSGPSYTLMFTLMFLLMSAKDLVQERRLRTLDRLRLSHAGAADLTIGFFLANFVTGAVQIAILLGLNSLLFGIDYGDAPVALALVGLLFAAFSAGAGLLLGCLARTPGQADALGMVVGLSLPALGGLWWPLEITPPFMQALGRALPSGQAITVFHDMIGRGWGVAQTAPNLVGLAIWSVAVVGASVIVFRRAMAAGD